MDLNNLPRTKIVCTIGPSSSTKEMIVKLIDAGMNVARLNFSHGDHAVHAANISLIREISKEKNIQVAILQDLQGPKIRTGKLINGGMTLTRGQRLTLRYAAEQTSNEFLPIDYRELASDVKVGARILLDDGLLSMKIIDIRGSDVDCEVTHGGFLKSRKGVNFPECHLSIPATTEKDIRDLLFGVAQGVDYVALSFVQTPADVAKLKMMLRALGADTPVITKVEMLSAVHHIDEICDVSDGIMVARGDLGVECGFANVAAYQKKIIESALNHGKPVIVATQMLDSMIEHRRPTKAEVCDVANAVFDHADATMLSGESASGKYPELAVATMRNILDRVDKSKSITPFEPTPLSKMSAETSAEVFARTTVELAEKMKATAIICLTLTGSMARYVAKYRPQTPIIAFSPRPDVVRKLCLVRGVIGVLNNIFYDTDTAFSEIAKYLAKEGYVKEGDLVLITGGIPVSQMLPTNTLKIHRVSKNDACS
ncbi:pyruvate kinase [Silvanigrella aquatica]|uniref:Pyruvate kinase n=1 Tax=Silvanigrella aquatica TaxID=1915309 RepID=A0A1L4D1U3_9BACT|nr:pyruvate kinase [Silvanigrella aquatica]APJ04167.1 pyruvate kinase [Silvanigrella aquatica]